MDAHHILHSTLFTQLDTPIFGRREFSGRVGSVYTPPGKKIELSASMDNNRYYDIGSRGYSLKLQAYLLNELEDSSFRADIKLHNMRDVSFSIIFWRMVDTTNTGIGNVLTFQYPHSEPVRCLSQEPIKKEEIGLGDIVKRKRMPAGCDLTYEKGRIILYPDWMLGVKSFIIRSVSPYVGCLSKYIQKYQK